MIKDENTSLSKNQLIEDVKELEIEEKSVPESLERDLKRASQGLDQEKMLEDAAENVADKVIKDGTTSLMDERVFKIEEFKHRGFFVRLFTKNDIFFGDAVSIFDHVLAGNKILFNTNGHKSLLKCGQTLVNLVNAFHRKRKQ